ncbi:MAG: tetratricopeptide repeat protein, partial [Oscillospiraceae bacterium]
VYKSFVARNRMVYALLITATAGFFILAFSGYKRMGTERVIAYNEYAKTVEQMRIEGNTEGFDSAFEKAEALFTDRLDIHYQKALFMFERGEFDECIGYISDILASHPEYNDDAEIGDLLFVNANCYFEKEDYKSAIPKYRAAIDKKSDNGEYYRDYAISLARTGNTDKASEVLDKAIDLGLSEENICLVNGEIFFLKESYENAEKELLNCIKISEDDYIKQRAYILCSKVYRISERYEDNIALLEEAMKKLPEGRLYSVYELLAAEYMDMGKISGEKDYYLKAVDIFTIMQDKGIGGYRISENKAIAYFTIADYDLAKKELIKMRSDFGDNYRTEMYLAYVENGIQSQKDNNKRNYSDFVGYYKKAKALYEKQAKAGETDMEMLALDDAYEQLKNGNWL